MSEDVEQQVAGALAATLGAPATEMGAYVADRIRFLRWRSAVRTLNRAKEIAQKEGLTLTRPALKFLVPFMEHCSLEEDDADIIELWSRLLVSAAVEFRPGHLLFMRLLREMTGSEARLLHDLATSGGVIMPDRAELTDAIANWERFSAPTSPFATMATLSDWADTREVALTRLQRPGILVDHLSILRLDEDTLGGFREVETLSAADTLLAGHDRVSVDILLSLGIVTHIIQSFDKNDEEDASDQYLRVEGAAFCLTAMGATFYAEVAGLPGGAT